MDIVRKTWEQLDASEIREVFGLWNRVWPREDISLKDWIEVDAGPRGLSEFLHLAYHGDGLKGLARSFEREIVFVDERSRIKVLALAGVCSDPGMRGYGFGDAVVRDAFSRVDDGGFALSLFQTGVPCFYERLGAAKVENRFVNSLNREDPEADPWWDEFRMIYPGPALRREGLVDLLGPGY